MTEKIPDAPKGTPTDTQEALRDRILAERDKGNIVVWAFDQLAIANLDEFVKQPADGMLYDLNRSEEISLTFIADKKWVNDFAVAQVIRKLAAQRDNAAPSEIAAPQHGETPRTDAVAECIGPSLPPAKPAWFVDADFARTLERALAESQARLAAAERERDEAVRRERAGPRVVLTYSNLLIPDDSPLLRDEEWLAGAIESTSDDTGEPLFHLSVHPWLHGKDALEYIRARVEGDSHG